MEAPHQSTGSHVSFWRLAAYASPAMVTSLAWMPLGYVIVKFYAKYTSLDLASIGIIILIARVFDGVSDPLVAFLSDKFETRWGRRKPWIVVSAPIVATGFALLFMPPENTHWSYFLFANIVMYSGWTFFEITHVAWGLEFERDFSRRSQIGVLLKLFAYLGALAFFVFPFLFNPDPNSSEFTRPVMAALGMFIAASFPILAMFAVLTVPAEQRIGCQPFNFKDALREIAENKKFRIYLIAFSAWALSDAILVALFITYIDVYHGLSAREGVILLAGYASRVVATPLALLAMKRFSRRDLWVVSVSANAVLFLSLAFFPQGEGAFPIILIYGVGLGLFDCLLGVLAITILGDIIDGDAKETKRDKAASYKASINLVEKIARAIGTSGSLIVVGAAGVVVGGQNSASSLWVLIAILAGATCLLSIASGLSMARLPPMFGAVRSEPSNSDQAEIAREGARGSDR